MSTDSAQVAEAADRSEAATPAESRRGHRRLWWTAGVFLALALIAAFLAAIWDWNWFRGPLAGMASARMHRKVTIVGNLKVHPFSWQPSATVEGVRIANPTWLTKGGRADPMASIDRIAVQIRLIPLFTGNVDLRLLEFDHAVASFYRDAQGRATWDFSDGRDKDKPLRLPPIRNFIIRDSKLSYVDDKRKLSFAGTVNASENAGGDNHGFRLTGQGALNKAPFTLVLTGGPLLNIDRNKPYPFAGELRAGDTFVTAQGAVPKPFDFGRFYLNTNARGPDLADLYALTGVPLPNTPAYALHGRLSRDEHLWRIDGLSGRVGGSDLNGAIAVKTGGERPFLSANLKSNSLSFPDLGALFGGKKAGASAAPAAPAAAHPAAAGPPEQHLLPTATLSINKIRALDADVTYNAISIRDAPIHLKSASARVKLQAGLLRAEPLAFGLPQGDISGWVTLDARKAVPSTELDLRMRNARLESLAPVKFQGRTPFSGGLVGRARLHGVGNSVHAAFAKADGEMMLVVPGGQINEALAELIGVDLTKGLGLLGKQTTTPIRCGVAHFKATGGVMNADNIVLDTGPVLVSGSGSINLDTERLAFRIQGHPKEFRLVRVLLPITLEGPILHPKRGFQAGSAVAQGGIALALGSLLSPLAAILPFVDPGLTKDANCGALMAQGKAEGAPVKTPAVIAKR